MDWRVISLVSSEKVIAIGRLDAEFAVAFQIQNYGRRSK
jgi:hypothetical protein